MHKRLHISPMAFGSLGGKWTGAIGTRLRRLPAVAAAAHRTGKTPDQVLLRFGIQHYGAVVIPTTTRLKRMRDNLDLFTWHLTSDEVRAIAIGDGTTSCAY